MRKTIWITLLTLATVTGWFAPAPEAQAIDPVTIAILAPAAMRMAETAQPYVIQGIAGGAQGLAQMGMAAFKILYIPWGVVQCTLGLPLGGLSSGVANICEGGAAPFWSTREQRRSELNFIPFPNPSITPAHACPLQ